MITAPYNYMQVQYLPRPATKASTHKSSELRHIYLRIVDMNKLSPLYLVQMSKDKQSFAIQIKESAMALNEIVRSIAQEDDESLLKKKAVTGSEDAVTAIITTKDQDSLPDPFTIKVNQLALHQSNQGNAIPSNANGLSEGEYSFQVNVNNDKYDFNFYVASRTNNQTALHQLASYINDSHIGITATVDDDTKKKTTSMTLASDETGSNTGKIFSLKDTSFPSNRGLVEYFGLNQLVSRPQNALFELNHEEKESSRNSFLLDKKLRLYFHQVTEQPVTVDYTIDADHLVSKLTSVIDSYNTMTQLANEHSADSLNAKSLSNELSAFIDNFYNELESCGVTIEENRNLSLDSYVAYQAALDGEISRLLTDPDGICRALLDKTSSLSINPMNYVDKVIVSYPNLSQIPFANPYITSMYSGMLFNSYC